MVGMCPSGELWVLDYGSFTMLLTALLLSCIDLSETYSYLICADPVGDVEESIKSGGLAAIKTERIKVCMHFQIEVTATKT